MTKILYVAISLRIKTIGIIKEREPSIPFFGAYAMCHQLIRRVLHRHITDQ